MSSPSTNIFDDPTTAATLRDVQQRALKIKRADMNTEDARSTLKSIQRLLQSLGGAHASDERWTIIDSPSEAADLVVGEALNTGNMRCSNSGRVDGHFRVEENVETGGSFKCDKDVAVLGSLEVSEGKDSTAETALICSGPIEVHDEFGQVPRKSPSEITYQSPLGHRTVTVHGTVVNVSRGDLNLGNQTNYL
ncbi:hypothetical protein Q5752_005363 [Cryptotrichosporon argae]